ncbi:MAG: hypothetical protein ACFFG0_30760 [Candidatus Thorarchaeota archaeon]
MVEAIVNMEKQLKTFENSAMQGTDHNIQLLPKEELIHLFNLIEGGLAIIESLMKEQSSDEITIPRSKIAEIFNPELFINSGIDGYPLFKPEVLEIFMFMGILIIQRGNVIKFIKSHQN